MRALALAKKHAWWIMTITDDYIDKVPAEPESDIEVLPAAYQAFLDSQQPKVTTEEDESWAQLQSF